MYRALSHLDGITYISVGHRPSLHQYHTTQMRLTMSGAEKKPAERSAGVAA